MEEIELNNDELRSTTVNKLDGDPKIGWLCNKNGLLLKTYGWVAKKAVGIIFLIHGIKSHTRLTFMRINLQMPNNDEGLVVDTNNYYIYKDSWIEKFNQNGYSVYGIDLQGHGESQAWKNVRGDFSSFDDIVNDVIQYMNQIQDEISNENQMDDESHDIVTTKKKRLPMYIIGHSMGGGIALRILQLLGKEQKDKTKAGKSSNYKNRKAVLDKSTNINQIDNDMIEDMISDNSVKHISNKRCITNSKNDGPGTSSASISATINASTSDDHEIRYNYLDDLNIKGCVSLSGMVRLKTSRNAGNKSFKYFYLPAFSFLSCVMPHKRTSSSRYKKSEYYANICKYDKFRNSDEIKYRNISECIKATVTLNGNIKYMPNDIPLLFVHSKDDTSCSYEAAHSFYNKANVHNKKFHPLDDMNHAITIETGNEEVLKTVIDWISDVRSNCEDEIEDE
ncbi:lysophospholipase, putative [Plasmodium chabaudi chabaudi]|uniref:Lysophospholipase, putative n=1 Tax=Plasmodium chabaudi chabaudi TaxID=31271 RepID=A0A1C6YLG5_PLACU|nr:lysophospholipase, putative [Plasmodium chabaudi chabaudi]